MPRSPRRIALASGGAVLALLVLAQIVLPGVAERRLRGDLERYGQVRRVDVHAFPAIELLWHHADRVTVRVSRYTSPRARLADFLARADSVGRLDARADVLRTDLLTLRDARVTKRGDELRGQAGVTDADLRAALPAGVEVHPIATGGGRLVLEGSATILGARLSARATLLALDGRLVIRPDLPLLNLLALTVFDDKRVTVEAVGARPRADGFTLTGRARLR